MNACKVGGPIEIYAPGLLDVRVLIVAPTASLGRCSVAEKYCLGLP